MFKDIGKQIKNWAKANYVIGNIVCLLAGIIFFFGNEDEDITWVGFLIMFGGTITISAFSTLLYGFGELVEDVHTIRCKTVANRIEPTYTTQSQATSNSSPAQKQTTSPVVAAVPVATKGDPNKSNAPISAEIKDGEKVCPKCGTAQRIDRRVCWSCGQPFDN